MDGFKLLEAIGLELDLPVISEHSSSSSSTLSAVARQYAVRQMPVMRALQGGSSTIAGSQQQWQNGSQRA
jgi:hypothetical protein